MKTQIKLTSTFVAFVELLLIFIIKIILLKIFLYAFKTLSSNLNTIKIQSSFKSNEYILKKVDGPYYVLSDI